jgi:hypothetical protein
MECCVDWLICWDVKCLTAMLASNAEAQCSVDQVNPDADYLTNTDLRTIPTTKRVRVVSK